MCFCGVRKFDQIPTIAVEIFKYRNRAISGLERITDEADAACFEGRIVALEVIGGEEQEHATSRLIADEIPLFRVGGACEQD